MLNQPVIIRSVGGHRLIRASVRLTCLSSSCPAPRVPPMTLSVLVSGRCDPNTNLQTSEVEEEEEATEEEEEEEHGGMQPFWMCCIKSDVTLKLHGGNVSSTFTSQETVLLLDLYQVLNRQNVPVVCETFYCHQNSALVHCTAGNCCYTLTSHGHFKASGNSN